VNRLAEETSPYLRQHADNPVDWYPWGDEAFARARDDDIPVFLSVGYSACHWCHVMAHESFEDAQTAKEINTGFVPVKVDREERPDVDAVYMDAVQAMNGHGGWPMSVFLTPDGRPFFAGTYYPPVDRPGLPSFRRVLGAVRDAWHERRADVERQADTVLEALVRRSAAPAGARAAPVGTDDAPGAALARAVGELAARLDPEWGGFGPAPKFPQPQLVELCLQHHHRSGDRASLAMAVTTLQAMAEGGIYDHLGGGFARYSTDTTWTVPHFEKMLYDQAGLVRAYLHAWQVTGDAGFRQVVEETVGYVLGTLRATGGGLYSAEDADSEGEEGRFYLWTPAELEAALGAERAAPAAEWYGVTPEGNFEGRTILRRPRGATLIRPPEIEAARAALLRARAERVRPGLDDKVLTEWNAMFGATLAEAAAATDRADWRAAAVAVAEFLLSDLRRADGRWLRSWQDGRARHLAYGADYAWLVELFTRLAELTGSAVWLERAGDVARSMLALFGGDDGLLYTTGQDAEALVVRPTEVLDGAVPAANSVAATALLRLGALSGDDHLTAAGEAMVDALAPLVRQHPLAAANTVAATGLVGGAITEVVVAGDRPDLVSAARTRYEPTVVLAWGERSASPLWAGRQDGLAYVCRHYTCRAPAASPEELADRLDEQRAAAAPAHDSTGSGR